jgi:hypothetical protein
MGSLQIVGSGDIILDTFLKNINIGGNLIGPKKTPSIPHGLVLKAPQIF